MFKVLLVCFLILTNLQLKLKQGKFRKIDLIECFLRDCLMSEKLNKITVIISKDMPVQIETFRSKIRSYFCKYRVELHNLTLISFIFSGVTMTDIQSNCSINKITLLFSKYLRFVVPVINLTSSI